MLIAVRYEVLCIIYPELYKQNYVHSITWFIIFCLISGCLVWYIDYQSHATLKKLKKVNVDIDQTTYLPLLTFVDIWTTTYLPRLVNVVCEWPLISKKYIFLYPSGGKREHVNKVRQPVKVEPKRYLISKASRASFADIFGSWAKRRKTNDFA